MTKITSSYATWPLKYIVEPALIKMQLTKFNLPVEIIDLISSLEPENQGIVYSHLFAYIYYGTEIGEDVDPRCRLILRLIIGKIESRVKRARQSQARKDARQQSPADETVSKDKATVRKDQTRAKEKSQAATPPASPVAARIMQNGRAVHDRISPFGQALYQAQLRANQKLGVNQS